MKKLLFTAFCIIVAQQSNLAAEQITQNKIKPEKDKKGVLLPRKYEQVSIVSYAKEPLYVGVFERRADIGKTPRLFGNIYKIEPGSQSAQGIKETVLRPKWDLDRRGLSDNDRLLYFTTVREDLGGDVTVAGVEPINPDFLAKTDCKKGIGCVNIGQGVFSTRNTFIIYPVDAQDKPNLNGSELRANEDSLLTKSIRSDLEKTK